MKLSIGDRVKVIRRSKPSYIELYKNIYNHYGIVRSISPGGTYVVEWFDTASGYRYYTGNFYEEDITLDKKYHRSKTIIEILQ